MSTAKQIRITNRQAWAKVQYRVPFKNSNGQLYSVERNGLYIVFSYGEHFPIYVYEPKTSRWFANEDKYSRTTTTHQSQAHPRTDTYPLSTYAMKELIRYGYEWLVAQRLTGAVL